MASDVWDRLNERLREVARTEAVNASPPVKRGKVVSVDPLEVELDGDTLSAEDEDVEVDDGVTTGDGAVEVGDIVRVHTAADGDYIISGRISG